MGMKSSDLNTTHGHVDILFVVLSDPNADTTLNICKLK